MEAPFSAWFGDGCTAVIVGKVPEDRGVLAHAHRTYGQFHRTIVASTRTGRWWDEGRVQLFSADPEGARRSFLEIADCAGDVVGTALRDAGCQHGDVDFFAPHQPTSWFREATRGHLGLEGARSLDTFSWAGSLAGANIPLALSVAENEGQLRDGDRVVMFAGGVGLTCAGMVVRWGRG
jgi:3-oxoacyl-[acyl-carrier-protein] synthase-3